MLPKIGMNHYVAFSASGGPPVSMTPQQLLQRIHDSELFRTFVNASEMGMLNRHLTQFDIDSEMMDRLGSFEQFLKLFGKHPLAEDIKDFLFSSRFLQHATSERYSAALTSLLQFLEKLEDPIQRRSLIIRLIKDPP